MCQQGEDRLRTRFRKGPDYFTECSRYTCGWNFSIFIFLQLYELTHLHGLPQNYSISNRFKFFLSQWRW